MKQRETSLAERLQRGILRKIQELKEIEAKTSNALTSG